MQEQLRFIKEVGIHQSEVVFAATGYIRASSQTLLYRDIPNPLV